MKSQNSYSMFTIARERELETIWKSLAAAWLRTLEWNSLLFCATEFNSSLIFIYGRNKYVPRTLQELLIRWEKLHASHVVE